jgi:tetratricopeptide (TPR) repeat protein
VKKNLPNMSQVTARIISFSIASELENHARAHTNGWRQPRRKEEIILNHSSANGFDITPIKEIQPIKPIRKFVGKYHLCTIVNFILISGFFLLPIPVIGADTNKTSQKIAQFYANKTAAQWLNEGLQAIEVKRVDEAILAFEQAARLDPSLAQAHYNLGLALRQSGKLQPAADAFYKAIQANPKFAPAYASLGGALLEGNNFQLAEDYLERAIKIDSKLGFAHYNLGLLRYRQRNFDKAVSSLKKSVELSKNAPDSSSYSYYLGLSYIEQKKFDRAKDSLGKAIKINPKYAEAHYTLGSIFYQEGKLNEALDAFRKSAEANEQYPNAYFGAGLVFIQQRQYQGAANVFKSARDLFSNQNNPEWARKSQDYLLQIQQYLYLAPPGQ